MPAIKALSKISAKWSTVAARSGDSYKEGVENPRKDWQTETVKANANWKSGTQAAISANRFETGVRKRSTDEFKRITAEKGPSRYQAGVSLASGNFERGFAPYAEVIQNTTLPERKTKGDPANINRVSVMAKALHDKKLALTSGK
jgi:hypothetical protein